MKKCILYVVTLFLFSCTKEHPKVLFTKMSSEDTGINFVNKILETETFHVLEYSYLYNGGGIAVGDINNDGLPDIYFTGNMVRSHLYINKGNFKFEEIAKQAGVFAEGLWNTGVTMADVNADGLLDIYVCKSAAKNSESRKNLLFINNGNLTFTEKAKDYGIADSGYTTQASFFDYDNDGDLDLYVLNHSTQEYAGFDRITPTLKKKKKNAYSDKLYRNDNGYFVDISEKAGLISNVLGFGLGISVSDINNDGWKDIYVSNDYNEQDYLYINNQDGTFSEKLEEYIGHVSLYSMGSDIADINNDGYTDIITLDMLPESNYRQKMVSGPDNYEKHSLLEKSGFYHQTMRNMLQLNNQGISFSEIGQLAGISNTDWSWSPLIADFDNDGLNDIYITNGYKRDYTNMDFINYAVQERLNENKTGQRTAISEILKNIPSTIVENYMYQNNGDLTFKKRNSDWGLNQKSLSNGAAYADFDNDGDLDLVVNNIEENAFLYRNNSETLNKNTYLKIRLEGSEKNTLGLGAKVEIECGGKIMIRELIPSRGFQSSVPYELIFGLKKDSIVEKIHIEWNDKKVQELKNIAANQIITLNYNDALDIKKENQTVKPYFEEVDSLLTYKHQENVYNDFKRERLLPHQLSTQGVRMAQGDINGDGLEDIFIGGAKGFSGQVFIQLKSGSFQKLDTDFLVGDIDCEDVDAYFFDVDGDTDLDLYVVSGGNEFEVGDKALQDRLYINNGKGKFVKKKSALPQMLTSGSCITVGDIDSDGDLDLFVGGRVSVGQYPKSPKSYILINDGKGNFKNNTVEINPDLQSLGMVTDALWLDFNSDKKLDFIVVGEWMPIRFFINTGDHLKEVTDMNNHSEGFWNRILAEDFDNDGDLDIIAGNFGLNSQLKTSVTKPAKLYVKDFDNNGSIDPILTSYIMGESYPAFSKDDLLGQLSILKNKYISYESYADQKIFDVFTSDVLKGCEVLQAKEFRSIYIENLGDGKFNFKSLPIEVQFAPVYSLLSEDFNKDGHKDILLGGNFFGTRVKYGRYDANKGILLLGNGTGDFRVVDPLQSGLNIDGEVRDIGKINLQDNKNAVLFIRNNNTVKYMTY